MQEAFLQILFYWNFVQMGCLSNLGLQYVLLFAQFARCLCCMLFVIREFADVLRFASSR